MPMWKTPWVVRRAVDLILAQTHRDLQLVVTNDGDKADAWNWLAGLKDSRLVRFDLEKNRGPYYANQVVLEATAAPLFTVHDSDDWSQSDRLEVLYGRLGAADVAVDGFTRHGLNDQTTRIKTTPNLIGHQSQRALWHIAHHKGLWQTDALRPLTMGPQFRMGWDTYLMHLAALCLKVEWVDYYGYNQQRRAGSLILSPQTGVKSKARTEAIVKMAEMWRQVQADPSTVAEVCRPSEDLQAKIDADVERLRGLL